MNSFELVKNSIKFNTPERLPFTGSMGDTDFEGDTVSIFPDLGSKWWQGGGGTDEWGCRWEVSPEHKDMGQVKNILIKDLSDFDHFEIPNGLNPERYKHWPEILENAEKMGKYVVCCNGSFIFERLHFLHGFGNSLMDIMIEPELISKAILKIAQYHLDTVEYINQNFQGLVHGYRGTDDWGSQLTSLISPDIFSKVFKPVYTAIFSEIRAAGMDTWMHSCGQISGIMDHLIEAGLEVINLLQPSIFPIPELVRFKGKINFEVCADIQMTLPNGDKKTTGDEISQLIKACCTNKGGLIERRLNEIHFKGEGISPDMGEFCHTEYRRLDPFIRQ